MDDNKVTIKLSIKDAEMILAVLAKAIADAKKNEATALADWDEILRDRPTIEVEISPDDP